MRQKIHFTGKNLNDVMFLPCVAGILKDDSGLFLILCIERMSDCSHYVAIGDWLVEEEDGKWHVEAGGEDRISKY